MNDIAIIDTTINNVTEYGVCGYKNIKKEGFPEKFEWLKKCFPEGLKIKTLYSKEGGTQGMIEYIPGQYCWRPVNALLTVYDISKIWIQLGTRNALLGVALLKETSL